MRGARAGDGGGKNLGFPDPDQAKPNHLLLLHGGGPGWDSELQVALREFPSLGTGKNTRNKLWKRHKFWMRMETSSGSV